MLKTIFFISLSQVFFAYMGYPLILILAGLVRRIEVRKKSIFPAVTMIITAFNEEKKISEKLENTLAFNYPKDKIQVIVASDGSTDSTNQIVSGYADRGIRLLPVAERRGKENAQKEAIKLAVGDILIFSDVATRIDPIGLQQIVSNFADPSIGCVSSEDRLVGADGRPVGEGVYVRYEMWLRRLESKVGSLVGLSGSFFAARKSVCVDFSGEMQSDFRTLLSSIRLGMRGVSDPEAVGYYRDVSDPKREMDRKVRTVLRGLTVFFRNLDLLNFSRYGLFSFQLFCHKLMRWLVPGFLAVSLATNLFLATESAVYAVLLCLQAAFYGAAVIARIRSNATANLLLKIPSYFLTVNLAIARAWWRYLVGERIVMWEPSER
jgi:glycosyltransferase involved in cell wall biosynthesis